MTWARAGHGRRRGPVCRGAVAELAVLVPAPALNRPPGKQRAGVVEAGGKRRHARQPSDAHRRGTVGGRRVAELAGEVRSPAASRVVIEQGAGVCQSRSDRDHPRAARCVRGEVRGTVRAVFRKLHETEHTHKRFHSGLVGLCAIAGLGATRYNWHVPSSRPLGAEHTVDAGDLAHPPRLVGRQFSEDVSDGLAQACRARGGVVRH
jgi:hypothetical protein